MAYVPGTLTLMLRGNGFCHYRYDTTDPTDTVDTAGYFSNEEEDLNLHVGDKIETVIWSGAVRTGTVLELRDYIVMSVAANGDVNLSDDILNAYGNVVGFATASTITTALTPNLPAHAPGDLLMLSIHLDTGAISVPTVTGWTFRATAVTPSNPGNAFRTETMVFTKIAGVSEVAPSITLSAAPVSGALATVVAVSGVSTVDDVKTIGYDDTAGAATRNAAAVTATATGRVVIVALTNYRNSDVLTLNPTGATATNLLSLPDSSPSSDATGQVSWFKSAAAGTTGLIPFTSTVAAQTYRPTAVSITFS